MEHGNTQNPNSFLRRWGLLCSGLLLMAIGGIWAAIAYAATTVEVTAPNGTTRTFDINEINPDIEGVNYKTRDGYRRITGVSIYKLLDQVNIEPDEWTVVTIEGLTVTNGEYRDKKPPVFEANEQSDNVDFFRPKSSDGLFVKKSAGNGNLDLDFQVPVKFLNISDTSPKPGQTVDFEVEVPNGGAQNAYTFRWDAGTAGSGTGKKFKVTYPSSAGKVDVSVTASRDGRVVATAVSEGEITQEDVDAQNAQNSSGTDFGGTGGFTSPSTPPPSFPSSPSTPSFPDDIPTPPTDPAPNAADTGIKVAGELLSFTNGFETGTEGATPLPDLTDPADPLTDPATGEDSTTPLPLVDPSVEVTPVKEHEIDAPRAFIALGAIFTLMGLGAGREFERLHPKRLLKRPNLSGLRRLPLPWK